MSIRKSPALQAFLLGVLTVFFLYFILSPISNVSAQQAEVERLRDQIEDRNDRLEEIEAEIAEYKEELKKVGAERSTLQNAINQLELERRKVNADIAYTQNRIGSTDLEISKLNIEISDTERSIDKNEGAIAEILRRIQETDNDSFIEMLLRHENISEFWNTIESLQEVRGVMSDEVKSLTSQKILLENKRQESNVKRSELVSLREQYSDQNAVLSNNKAEKDELLRVTQSEEAEYQSLLTQRETAREQILRELREFESQLQFILDPNTIPVPGTTVFNWPVEDVVITQLFGGTEFARQNAFIYGGRPYHPGVDFGVPRGSKIFAPLSGTIRAVGNTDAVPGCYSWGKWILLDHANGLSTLYAHLDLISVSPGQQVRTGEVIGYSGNTGYSTGPHLHFTVYAKAGVEVRKFSEIKTVTSCGPATTPIAATDAYIDPMLYLPSN